MSPAGDGVRPEEVLEALLRRARKTGAAEAEVYVAKTSSLAVAAKGGVIDQVRRHDEFSAALRLIDQGRLGFAHTSVFSPAALDETAARAAAGFESTDPQPGLGLPGPPAGPWPVVEGPDLTASAVPLEEKMAAVLEMERVALAADSRVERVRTAEYREGSGAVWLANSLGLVYSHAGTVFSGTLTVKAVEHDQAEMGGWGEFSRKYKELDLRAIGREAALRAVMGLGGIKVKTYKGPVILENSVMASFIGVLAGSFPADGVRKGKSLLAGKLGEKIAAEEIDLADDGLWPGGIAASPADGEGVPRRRTALIKDGVLQGFLYDVTHARLDGRESTGNAVRGLKSPPGIGVTNLVLQPGKDSLEQLQARLGEGLLVADVLGVHTANPITGNFSLGCSGFWIKNGRILHPVKGMALAGNLLSLLTRTVALGSDARKFGAISVPSALVDGLTVSGL
ncbi:MAG: TldD/PmbA family protein [Pseudomonadota bacterium]